MLCNWLKLLFAKQILHWNYITYTFAWLLFNVPFFQLCSCLNTPLKIAHIKQALYQKYLVYMQRKWIQLKTACRLGGVSPNVLKCQWLRNIHDRRGFFKRVFWILVPLENWVSSNEFFFGKGRKVFIKDSGLRMGQLGQDCAFCPHTVTNSHTPRETQSLLRSPSADHRRENMTNRVCSSFPDLLPLAPVFPLIELLPPVS